MLICQPKLKIDVTPCVVLRVNQSLVGILHIMAHYITVRSPIHNRDVCWIYRVWPIVLGSLS
jgi:hypothetical protein